MKWRVGSRVPLNIYRGDTPVCQCHTIADAAQIVHAMNSLPRLHGALEEIANLRIDYAGDAFWFMQNVARGAIVAVQFRELQREPNDGAEGGQNS